MASHRFLPLPRGRVRAAIRLLPVICGACALGGCAALVPPQPWQKGALARPEMTMQADVLAQRHGLHVYTSRESAAGGHGVGGGGCGCN